MGLLERGKANPTIRTLDRVAQHLGIDVVDLLVLATVEKTAGASAARPEEVHQALRRGRPAESKSQPAQPIERRSSGDQWTSRHR